MGMKQYPESKAMGDGTEEHFEIVAARNDWTFICNADKEQQQKHWDKLYRVNLISGPNLVKAEVKGEKALSRGEKVQSDFILLELHGVDLLENEGWIYGSEAQTVIFYIDSQFHAFKRQSLIDFIADKIGVTGAYDPKIKETKVASKTYTECEVVPYRIYHRYIKGVRYRIWDYIKNIPLANRERVLKEHEGSKTLENKDAFIYVPRDELMTLKPFTFKN